MRLMQSRGKPVVLSLMLILASLGSARAGERSGTTVQLMSPSAFGRVGIEFWSSGGAGVAEEGLVSAPFSNPASGDPKTFTLSLEAGKRSRVKWLGGVDYDGQWIVPAYVSLAIPCMDWSASLGYANFYNLDLSITGIPVTTAAYPDGTGQTYDFERSVVAHTFFGSARYSPSRTLSIGLTMGVNILQFNERIFGLTTGGEGYGVVAIAGALVKVSPAISLGSKITIAPTVDLTQQFITQTVLSNPGGRTQLVAESYIYRAAFPWMAEAGIDWKLFDNAQLLASVEYQRWSAVTDYFQNRWQFHLGTAIEVSPGFTTRFGFFTQKDASASPQPYGNENFLTTGIEYRASEHVSLSASDLDSHLFSTSDPIPGLGQSFQDFRQTHAAIGASYAY